MMYLKIMVVGMRLAGFGLTRAYTKLSNNSKENRKSLFLFYPCNYYIIAIIFIFYNIMLSLQNFLIYTAAFYGNLGNYKSFGDTKFVPDLPKVQYCFFCTVMRLEL